MEGRRGRSLHGAPRHTPFGSGKEHFQVGNALLRPEKSISNLEKLFLRPEKIFFNLEKLISNLEKLISDLEKLISRSEKLMSGAKESALKHRPPL
jgi:hypothetical protein